jgi:hypothetical protein
MTLHAIRVQDENGGDLRVGDAWSDGPALLVFLRHFG